MGTKIDYSKAYVLNTSMLNELNFDINFLEIQVKECKKWIDHGNWSGYSENLKLRKERLERETNILIELKQKRKELWSAQKNTH